MALKIAGLISGGSASWKRGPVIAAPIRNRCPVSNLIILLYVEQCVETLTTLNPESSMFMSPPSILEKPFTEVLRIKAGDDAAFEE